MGDSDKEFRRIQKFRVEIPKTEFPHEESLTYLEIGVKGLLPDFALFFRLHLGN